MTPPKPLTNDERRAIREFLRWRGDSLQAADAKLAEFERERLDAARQSGRELNP